MNLQPFAKLEGVQSYRPQIVAHNVFPSEEWPRDVPARPVNILGRIADRWIYRSPKGLALFAVYRIETIDSSGNRNKSFSIYDCQESAYRAPKNRPIYGLDRVLDTPGPVVVVEGEKTADALLRIGVLATTTPFGCNGVSHARLDGLEKREIVIWPDNDQAGFKYRDEITQALVEKRSKVYWCQPPPSMPTGWDASDAILDGWKLEKILEFLNGAIPAEHRESEIFEYFSNERGIFVNQGSKCRQLTNFRAVITRELVRKRLLGDCIEFELKIIFSDGTSDVCSVPAIRFRSLDWVEAQFGARAIVFPGQSTRDLTRAAIQKLSGVPPKTFIYEQMGFHQYQGKPVYLHSGGAIGIDNKSDIIVDLPHQLKAFELPAPTTSQSELEKCIQASLAITNIAAPEVTYPLLTAVFRAPLGKAAFCIWIVGPTGAGKSILAALAQQHYGPTLTYDNLPSSWASTANSLEAIACAAKDSILVVDDFVPKGGNSQVENLNHIADRLLRGQGNRSGRSRLSQHSKLQRSFRPEGLIVATGEDAPVGASLRARMLILELDGSSLDFDLVGKLQQDAALGQTAQMMSNYVAWLAQDLATKRIQFEQYTQDFRSHFTLDIGHRRTALIAAELKAAFAMFVEFCVTETSLTRGMMTEHLEHLDQTLNFVVNAQLEFQSLANPAVQFIRYLGSAIATGQAHVVNINGLTPERPACFGWRQVGQYLQPSGPLIGWVEKDALYIDPTSAFRLVRKLFTGPSEALNTSDRMLTAALDHHGYLKGKDPPRGGKQRKRIRKLINGRRHSVLQLDLDTVLGVARVSPSSRGRHHEKDSK